MENRTADNAQIREIVGQVQSTCNAIRNLYPERYPVPPEVDAMLCLEDAVIALARGGDLNRVA